MTEQRTELIAKEYKKQADAMARIIERLLSDKSSGLIFATRIHDAHEALKDWERFKEIADDK